MAALAENPDAEVEYAIALFNGTGVTKESILGVAPEVPSSEGETEEETCRKAAELPCFSGSLTVKP